jgi:hypothetical protein
MSNQLDKIEHWLDKESDSRWKRDPVTNLFTLTSFHEKQVDDRWGSDDIAKALKCGLSNSSDDGAQSAGAVAFPPGFKYSPNTGKPLTRVVTKIHTWTPVSGSEDLTSGLVRGGRVTSHRLKLKGDSFLNRKPDHELPLPGHGQYRFIAGAFGLSSSFLLALNGEQGAIYCWLPNNHEWAELEPTGDAPYLGTETLLSKDWNIEIQDISGESILLWPADSGLIAIKVDVLSLSYEAKLLVMGRCLSVPHMIKNMVYILIEKDDGTVSALSINSDWKTEVKTTQLSISNIPSAEWIVAVATTREIIWLSDVGQVVIRPNAHQYFYIPWETGIKPQFLLGGPHCSLDGHLWMQVLHPDIHEGEGGFCYIQLGRQKPELRPSFGARTLTGKSSIKVERWLKDDPWLEPTLVSNMSHENNEAVIPILESSNDDMLLVLRVDHLLGITKFFDRKDEILTTRFQIMGQHGDEGFYVKRLREPWTATAFIFEEILFIYHPDIGFLPGWLTIPT